MMRELFVDTGTRVVELLRHEEVAGRWTAPSALDRMTVAALAGHLSRAVVQVEVYLDRPVSDDEPIDAAAYFTRLGDDPGDLDSPLNTAIRGRSEHAAQPGPDGVAAAASAALDRLADRLPREPADRRIEAFGAVLLLDDYLVTRLVEMAVHFDDLCVSVDAEVEDLDDAALDVAAGVLWEMAVRRHGRRAVLTALSRRERDVVSALRVI
jgi:hypothetical protein